MRCLCASDTTTDDPTEPSKSSRYSKILASHDDRLIGYTLVPPLLKKHRDSAIVFFYALSSSSLYLNYLNLVGYQCNVLCVDRPSCGKTSPSPRPKSNEDPSIHRIEVHVQDVLEVLKQHPYIRKVYALAVCLGHVYAIEFCRRLLNRNRGSRRSFHWLLPELQALTMVAPFVSTAYPNSWWLAKMGAGTPSVLLYGATETMSSVGYYATSLLLKPSHLKSLLSKKELELWTDEDMEEMRELLLEMSNACTKSKGVEARLGASPSWQVVCDKFAAEYNLLVVGDGEAAPCLTVSSTSSVETAAFPIPIRILASPHDNLAKPDSIKWISDRCYGGATEVIYVEHKASSHAIMTMLGGPPRNPAMLHKIARKWGLLPAE